MLSPHRQPIGPFALLGLLVSASPALASGFELREASAEALGTSYAGAAATNSDASFVFYNPASLSGVRDFDAAFTATGLLLDSSATFSGTTAAGTPTGGLTTPSGFIGNAVEPGLSLRARLSEGWTVGLSFTTPWGEVTHYPDGWTGRYYALATSLTVYNVTPVVAYDVTPEFTLAAGPQIQYARSKLTAAIDFGTIGAAAGIPGSIPGAADGSSEAHGHAWSAGFVLGALWRLDPSLSLGVSYRSRAEQGLKGTETFQFDSQGIAATINALTGAFVTSVGKADLPTPSVVMAGLRWAPDERWTALAGLEYTGWSALKNLLLVPSNPANPTSLTVLNWKDGWFGSLGAEYRVDPDWILRVGTAYDGAAAPKETVEPRIADADRYWVSIGAGYHWNSHADLDLAVMHLFTPQSTIAQSVTQPGNAARGSLMGVTNSSATLIGLQVSVR
jgi:long-chain fatty acid transport protein